MLNIYQMKHALKFEQHFNQQNTVEPIVQKLKYQINLMIAEYNLEIDGH